MSGIAKARTLAGKSSRNAFRFYFGFALIASGFVTIFLSFLLQK